MGGGPSACQRARRALRALLHGHQRVPHGRAPRAELAVESPLPDRRRQRHLPGYRVHGRDRRRRVRPARRIHDLRRPPHRQSRHRESHEPRGPGSSRVRARSEPPLLQRRPGDQRAHGRGPGVRGRLLAEAEPTVHARRGHRQPHPRLHGRRLVRSLPARRPDELLGSSEPLQRARRRGADATRPEAEPPLPAAVRPLVPPERRRRNRHLPDRARLVRPLARRSEDGNPVDAEPAPRVHARRRPVGGRAPLSLPRRPPAAPLSRVRTQWTATARRRTTAR